MATAACLLCFSASTVWAEVHRVTVEYTEPTANADDTALTDLAMTRIYADFIGDGQSAITEDVGATATSGGGQISHELVTTFAQAIDVSQITQLNVFVTAIDQSGNESAMTGTVTLTPLTFEPDPVPPPPPPTPITTTVEVGQTCPTLDWAGLEGFDQDGVGIDASGWRVYLRKTPSEEIVSVTNTSPTQKFLFCVAPIVVDTYRYDVVAVGVDVVTEVESESAPTTLMFLTTIPSQTPPPPVGQPIQLNFQPGEAASVSGYLIDSGQPFTTALGYGWITAPRPQALESGVDPDQRLDTFVYFGSGNSGQWEYVLPNGEYLVTARAGDASFPQGPHFLTMEGVTIFSGASTSGGQYLQANSVPVTVADGRMTLTLTSTTGNAHLNYVILQPAGGPDPTGPPLIIPLQPPFVPFDPFDFGG